MSNNTIILIGNLGADPTTHTTKDGKEFTRLSICTQNSYQDDNGEWQNKKEAWHTVFFYGRTVQAHAQYGKKGQRFKITGELQYNETKAVINGEEKTFRDAIIVGRRIEKAPLVSKSQADDTTQVEELV